MKSIHHCQVCRKKFIQGDRICRLYGNHCFHEVCLEETLVREIYDDPWQDDESVQSTWTGSQTSSTEHHGLVGTRDGNYENRDHEQPEKVKLSEHGREYAAFPIQTKLKDGRPSIIIDPGSVGNLCGDRWAREVALMAKAHGRKPAHQRRERALQVSGVGNGSQQCHYDCQLPVAIRPEGGKGTSTRNTRGARS